MASTTTDDGFHEIQLNGKQLVFLFMAVTVVSVVIFLCGVLVGRGVPVDRAAAPIEAQAATVPPVPPSVTTTGSGAPASASEDLTYADRLSGKGQPSEQLKAPGAASTPAQPPTPAQAPAAPTPPPPAATTAAKPAPTAAPAAAPAPAEPAGSRAASARGSRHHRQAPRRQGLSGIRPQSRVGRTCGLPSKSRKVQRSSRG
jgi:pyruvate/2-oxoglutarate dehydrogenase complex dihydrolipoamide acyltransferase (E2) component